MANLSQTRLIFRRGTRPPRRITLDNTPTPVPRVSVLTRRRHCAEPLRRRRVRSPEAPACRGNGAMARSRACMSTKAASWLLR
jgi:hypothetical protein